MRHVIAFDVDILKCDSPKRPCTVNYCESVILIANYIEPSKSVFKRYFFF